jgi:MFS transporter, DHA3 family, macrolide efflux protein
LGTFAAVFAPCRLAIMPVLVGRRDLVTANAISSQVGNIATILALPLGGYLVDRIGRAEAFYVDAVAFCAATFLLLLVGSSRATPPKASAGESPAHRFASEFAGGWRYLRDHTNVRFAILFFGFLTLVSGILYVCLFSYSIEILGVEERGIGQLLGVLGVGMAVGAVFLVWKPKIAELPLLPYVGLAGAGAFIWLMSEGGSSHRVALLLFGVGFCGILALVPNDTYLQHHVPDKVRGRVFVVRGVAGGVVWLFSLQFVKSIVHHLGLVQVLVWLGVSTVAMAVFFALAVPTQKPENQ